MELIGSANRWRSGGRRVGGGAGAVMAALALALAGCGSQEADLGAEVAVSTTVTTAPTTTTSTIPTTTIDFDRPVAQGIEALDEEATADDVAALLDDIRGQTTNIAVQVERIAPFPGLAGPTVAQIMDVRVTLAPETDDGHPSLAVVRYRTPEAVAAMVKIISDDLRAQSWNKVDEAAVPIEDGEATELVFRISGVRPDDLELRARIEATTGPTVVELAYTVLADDEDADGGDEVTYFERLSAWQTDLPLPRAAELLEVAAETGLDTGTLSATYQLAADDETEAVALVAAAVAASDYELLGAAPDEPPPAGPLLLVDPDGRVVTIDVTAGSDEETFDLLATTDLAMTPLD